MKSEQFVLDLFSILSIHFFEIQWYGMRKQLRIKICETHKKEKFGKEVQPEIGDQCRVMEAKG